MAKQKRTTRTKKTSPQGWSTQLKDYGLGLVLGLGGLTLCFASIDGKITDDRALYQNLTEIRAQKQKDLNFDGDLAALRAAEARFQEKKLPRPLAKTRARKTVARSSVRTRVVKKPSRVAPTQNQRRARL